MASIGPSLRIFSLQSVMPTRVTEPGRSRRLYLPSPLRSEALQSRLRLILYYKRTCEEDTARTVAAWIKESLSVALAEQPVLAGRLRRNGEGGGNWEVKFNDAGVRLVEATAETTMEEVLGSKDRDEWETRLGYWKDVDTENPNFSALFFVQVTEFKGDGYSIGISCSLLLADPLFLTKFLREWALAHILMLAQGKLSRTPIFHLGYFENSRRHIRTESDTSSSTAVTTTTMFFKVVEPPVLADNIVGYDALLNRCIEEASKRLDGRAMQHWSLLVSDHSGDLEVKSFAKAPPSMSFDGTVKVSLWDEFGLEEMALSEGNKPIHVSYRVVSTAEHGLVVAMRATSVEEGDFGLLISVTVPIKA